MSRFRTDLHHLAGLNSDERLRALGRIIPLTAVQEVLRRTGHDRRHYRRRSPSFMALFVVALGLFHNDSHTPRSLSTCSASAQAVRPAATPSPRPATAWA